MKNTPIFSSPDAVNPNLLCFEAYEPGLSISEIKHKYGLERVIKLASNENMLGACPAVTKAIAEHGADLTFRYPQGGNPQLVKALSAHYSVPEDRIFAANGSDEVIDLLIRLKTVPGISNIVAFKPCFGVYSTQARINNVELRQTPLNEDFSFDFNALASLVDEQTSLVFITSPDNPSGHQAPLTKIIDFARALPPSCLLVLDEAYIEFSDNSGSALDFLLDLDNIAVLRTFSKVYGLAGLRIGYGFFPAQVASYLWRIRLPFSINSIAEHAAVTALNEKTFIQQTIDLARQGRAYLSAELSRLNCQVIPSQANFLMFRPPLASKPAAQLHGQLLERGVILRALGSYDLPDWLRLTVGLPQENEFFINVFEELL